MDIWSINVKMLDWISIQRRDVNLDMLVYRNELLFIYCLQNLWLGILASLARESSLAVWQIDPAELRSYQSASPQPASEPKFPGNPRRCTRQHQSFWRRIPMYVGRIGPRVRPHIMYQPHTYPKVLLLELLSCRRKGQFHRLLFLVASSNYRYSHTKTFCT